MLGLTGIVCCRDSAGDSDAKGSEMAAEITLECEP